jgi:hypothetical protein
MICWSIGFIFRLGAVYIRVGETYTTLKYVAVTMSFRIVQEFTFLREQEEVATPHAMLGEASAPTLNKTAIYVPTDKSHPQAQTHAHQG